MDLSSQSGMLSPNNSSTSFNNPSLSSISDANSSVYGRDSSTWQLNKQNASWFVKKYGRSYYHDESQPYPLPCDPEEVNHRQNLVHLLYKELFGGYYTAPFHTAADIPKRVLDIGCGNGQWIASVADEFASRGRPDVEFFGLDVVQVHSDMTGVNFTFRQFNILQGGTLPFETGEFDYIMLREMSMIVPNAAHRAEDMFEEYMRVLKPGGIIEIQCSDHTIRSLLQSSTVPDLKTGAYSVTASTPFAARPENKYAQQWNTYATEMMNKRMLSPVPCTLVWPMLVMETHHLKQVLQKRLALPLDDPTWEEELLKAHSATISQSKPRQYSNTSSVDDDALSFVTADSQLSSPEPPSSQDSMDSQSSSKTLQQALKLSEDARGVRYLAREIFAGFISSLEPILREANGVPQDEWDRWYRDLMKSFFEEGGLKGGECLELGAWYAVKHQAKEKDKEKEKMTSS